MIYIREAHACDEWQVWLNSVRNICFAQPSTIDERAEVAEQFRVHYGLRMPLLIDSMSDSAMTIYGAWPERLYLVDGEGRIVYQGAAGPWRFSTRSLEHAIISLLQDRD